MTPAVTDAEAVTTVKRAERMGADKDTLVGIAYQAKNWSEWREMMQELFDELAGQNG